MGRARQGLLAALGICAAAAPAGCGGRSATEEGPQPAEVVKVRGATQLTLTPIAAVRIGLQTAPVQKTANRAVTAIPYSAVLYSAEGKTFVYIRVRQLTYTKRPVLISGFQGGLALLRQGPPVGARVVSVGNGELLGEEEGVDEE